MNTIPVTNSSLWGICLCHSHIHIFFLTTEFRSAIYKLLHKKTWSDKQSHILLWGMDSQFG